MHDVILNCILILHQVTSFVNVLESLDKTKMDATNVDEKTLYIEIRIFFEFPCSEYLRAILLIPFKCVDNVHAAITNNAYSSDETKNVIINAFNKAKEKQSLTPVKLNVLFKVFCLGIVSGDVVSKPGDGWESTSRRRDNQIGIGDDIKRIMYMHKKLIKGNEDEEELQMIEVIEALQEFLGIGERFEKHSNEDMKKIGKKMQEDIRKLYAKIAIGKCTLDNLLIYCYSCQK